LWKPAFASKAIPVSAHYSAKSNTKQPRNDKIKQEKVTALCCHSCVSLILLHHPLVSDFLPPPSELTAPELCKNPTHSGFAGINVAEMPEANSLFLK
jgi:hypothetical protein